MDRVVPPGAAHGYDGVHVHGYARAIGQGARHRGVTNLNEIVVASEYDRLKDSFPGFCGCGACRDDVIVFALNKLPPRYVTDRRGAVLTHVRLQGEQEQADFSVALIEGFKRVMQAPRPDHEPQPHD